MLLEGKGALVTGGASGIGRGTASVLLEKGAKVCILDINTEDGERTVEQLRARFGDTSVYFIHCDVSKTDQLKDAFNRSKEILGRLDIVFNNAGVMGELKWEQIIAVNLKAVCHGSMLALEMMRKDKGNEGGVVINTSSVAGLIPFDANTVYCATKHAIVGLTRSLAARRDFSETQVRFNCVCPGIVDTPMSDFSKGKDSLTAKDFDEYSLGRTLESLQMMPNLKKLSPEDLGHAVADLIADDSYQGAAMFISPKGRELVNPPVLTMLDF